jgi:hypothetical protein
MNWVSVKFCACLHLSNLLSHYVSLLNSPTRFELGRAEVKNIGKDHQEHQHPCPNKLAGQHGFAFSVQFESFLRV